jgi:hypothetical protein
MKNILKNIETVRQAFSSKRITGNMQEVGEVIAVIANKTQSISNVLTNESTQQAVVKASKNARNNIAGLLAKVVINHYGEFNQSPAAPSHSVAPKQTNSAPQSENELHLV